MSLLKSKPLGFGRPAASLALIERELAERQGAVGHEQIMEVLSYTKLLPGATGHQVVSYLGWRLRGWTGALVSAAAFLTLPRWPRCWPSRFCTAGSRCSLQ